MSAIYGINWNETHGTAPFQYGEVIADIASYCHQNGYDAGDVWLNNIRSKSVLSQQKGDRTYARVSYVRSDTNEIADEEVARMNDENLPLLRIAFPSGLYKLYYPLSFQTEMPYEHRQWSANYADCYRLLLDYYKRELSIKLPVVVTPENYVAQSRSYAGTNLFLTNWKTSGFEQVIAPSHGDLLYMRTGGGVVQGPDHCGIYLEGDRILHHFIDRLSTVQEYAGLWRTSTVMVLRHHTRL